MHTLLIVEDEKMIRQGIKAMIQRSGVPVDIILECGNGEMALEILREQHVDVMFTDIHMPKMDGITLVKEMQSLPEKPLTVAISGYDEFSYAVEMLRAGIKEYLLKPVDRDQVKNILEKLETELVAKQEKTESNKAIGVQQIKHLIQDEFITENEKNTIYNEYGNSFYNEPYYVCCIENQPGEMCAEEDYVYINNIGDYEIYVVRKKIFERFKRQEFRKRFIGVSDEKIGLENLKEGFEEAKKSRAQAYWQSLPEVKYSEIDELTFAEGEEINYSLNAYVQMLGTDKSAQAIKQIGNVLWNARREKNHETIENEIVNFIDGLVKTYEAVLHNETDKADEMKHIYKYASVDDFERDFVEWLENFADKLNHQFEDYKNKQKVQQAVLYIRENFDKDLNMAVVSNYISMNYSLFSYAFKQYTGTNFVNYLKDIRMEKAKELLEKTDLRIVEISQKIGYDNEKHFMKIFKASFGVSPTEYRKNMQYKRE